MRRHKPSAAPICLRVPTAGRYEQDAWEHVFRRAPGTTNTAPVERTPPSASLVFARRDPCGKAGVAASRPDSTMEATHLGAQPADWHMDTNPDAARYGGKRQDRPHRPHPKRAWSPTGESWTAKPGGDTFVAGRGETGAFAAGTGERHSGVNGPA